VRAPNGERVRRSAETSNKTLALEFHGRTKSELWRIRRLGEKPRRTSWHVQSGTPLFALQEMGGWESPEMVRRYAHLAADHLSSFAERLVPLRVPERES